MQSNECDKVTVKNTYNSKLVVNSNLRSNRGSSRSQSQGSQHVLLKLEEKTNDVAKFVTVGTAVLKHLHPTTILVDGLLQ